MILGSKYGGYEDALQKLNIQSLSERREDIFENFTKKNYKNEKLKEYFKENNIKTHMSLKNSEKFHITKFKTNRLKHSTIIQMQMLLNDVSRKGDI